MTKRAVHWNQRLLRDALGRAWRCQLCTGQGGGTPFIMKAKPWLMLHGWCFALAMLTACSSADTVMRLATTEGRSVRQLAQGEGRHVVLILDPSECFTCYRGVAAWTSWAQEPGRHAVILLSRAPDPVERKGMLLAGVREDGILAQTLRLPTPVQIYVDSGAAPSIIAGATDADAFSLIARSTSDRSP